MYGRDSESLKSYQTILFPIRGLTTVLGLSFAMNNNSQSILKHLIFSGLTNY